MKFILNGIRLGIVLVLASNTAFAAGGFLSAIERIEDAAARIHMDSLKCEQDANAVVDLVRHLDPLQFPIFEIREGAPAAISALFEVRNDLKEEMQELYSAGALSAACAPAIRKVFRHVRGVEDFIGSIRALHGEEPIPANPNGPGFLPAGILVHEDVREPVRLQSGDILLSRGNANVSALIARMADEDTQFSHMAMVYIDPETREEFTIEAHIEFGSKIFPLRDWLKDGKVRTVIFRQKDPIRAAVAARYMFERVKSAQDAGRPVRYDFGFDMNDHREIFCSEVVRQGYSFASAGTFLVPAFPSKFTMKNRDILDRLGIRIEESFLPEDIELDPRFQLIAEWRDFSRIGAAVRKDAIMDAIYRWMEMDGLRFHPSRNHRLQARLGKVLRNLGFLKEKMPTYMRVRAIEMSLMIEELMGELEKMTEAHALRHYAETGLPFNFFQYSEELERLKAEGALKSASFRNWFHP
ncbi:MAG: hypothetical protein KGP28_08115 [Bdellovibrionales bacterium]|nr:hypothetical protein [Bdellovibrionales bacterium]